VCRVVPAAIVNCRKNCEQSLSVVIYSNYPGIGGLVFLLGWRPCRTGGDVGSSSAYIMYARGATAICRRPLAEAAESDYGQVGVTSLQYTESETDGRTSEALQEPSIPPDTLLSIKSVETCCLRPVLSADKKQMAESVVRVKMQRSTGDEIKAWREVRCQSAKGQESG